MNWETAKKCSGVNVGSVITVTAVDRQDDRLVSIDGTLSDGSLIRLQRSDYSGIVVMRPAPPPSECGYLVELTYDGDTTVKAFSDRYEARSKAQDWTSNDSRKFSAKVWECRLVTDANGALTTERADKSNPGSEVSF